MSSPRSPALEHVTALSIAQERARVNGAHLDECMRVVPSLRGIHTDLCESTGRLDSILARQRQQQQPRTPPHHHHHARRPSAVSAEVAETHARLRGLCQRLDRDVEALEQVQRRDRPKRMSLQAVHRAMGDVLGGLDEFPSPLSLVPTRPPSSTPTPHPSPAQGVDAAANSAAIAELSEVVRAVQKLHDDMKEKELLYHSQVHSDARYTLEQEYKRKVRFYKNRTAQLERLLQAHNIPPSSRPPAKSALARVLGVLLGFLNVGDLLVWLFQWVVSWVWSQPPPPSPSSTCPPSPASSLSRL